MPDTVGRRKIRGALWFLLGSSLPSLGLDDGLARVPSMGWNSWYGFYCNLTEKDMREVADSLVGTGLLKAGYRFLNLDDCWSSRTRDASGNLVGDAVRFPSGMASLAAYVHGKGLKFGIYGDVGSGTCAGHPGTRGYETQDAKRFAEWGVDHVKMDWCNSGDLVARQAYARFRDALRAAKRPIEYNICNWGTSKVWEWGDTTGHSWRTFDDIGKNGGGWDRVFNYGADLNAELWRYAGPGHWNDAEFLLIGVTPLTETESRAKFSLWSLMASPLILSIDPRKLPKWVKDIVTNEEVIAVNQDSLGRQGRKVRLVNPRAITINDPVSGQSRINRGDLEIWAGKPLRDGSQAAVLFNRTNTQTRMTLLAKDLEYAAGRRFRVRDLWLRRDLGWFTDSLAADVPGHGVAMYRIWPEPVVTLRFSREKGRLILAPLPDLRVDPLGRLIDRIPHLIAAALPKK